ncbi:MAG TPA: post-COAP-1 domain-containing protein, partial [Nocardioidaceae bacterium]
RANCASGTGACTLRAAMLEANAHPNDAAGPDKIVFAIPVAAPHVIAATSSLPQITDPVTIDAGLPAPGSPRQIELTGVDCSTTSSIACDGLVVAADSTTIRGLAINGFFNGIRVAANSVSVVRGAVIEGNYIGTNAAGDALKPHSTLRLDRALQLILVADSRIGGDPAAGEGNVIAGYAFEQIYGSDVTGTAILGNRIGTDPSGSVGLGGGGTGIQLSGGGGNVLGAPGAGNVISGLTAAGAQPGTGIWIVGSNDNVVQANRIGTDASGTTLVPNASTGLDLQANGTVVGGSPSAANVVSGNSTGIHVQDSPVDLSIPGGNEISYNLIGTDLTGTARLGNRGDGIGIDGTQNLIAHNVVSGNGTVDVAGRGIGLGGLAVGNRVESNLVGVGLDGTPLGNAGVGVAVSDDPFAGSGNVIGGSEATANHIAYNGETGVLVGGFAAHVGNPPGTTVRANSIHDNGGRNGVPALGIDLLTAGEGRGPDGIDPLDADDGANEKQNAPEIIGVTITGATTVVDVRLHSTPDEDFTVDLYDNARCDDTGYGEGERWLGDTTRHTAAADSANPGTVTFQVQLNEVISAPHSISATATNANGSTSEFSACGDAPARRAATATTYTGPDTATYSDPVTLSGRLEDTSGPSAVGIPGKHLDLALGTMPTVSAGPTGADGSATAAAIPVTLAPGPTTVVTSFTGDDSYEPSSDSDPVTVLKEDCTLAYTGDTLVAPLAQTRLRAQLGESDDYPGDWSGKLVTFTVTDSALATRTYTATTNGSGAAEVAASLNADVYGVSVGFAGDGYYNPCATPTDTIVTVAAAGSKVTGGGWISNSVGRTSFGFNAIPQTDGSFKGQLQVRSNSGKNTFHGNVVTGLVSLTSNSVRWTGTGRWNGVTGFTFVVTVVDNGSSGSKKADTIDLQIYRTGDPSHPALSTLGAQVLKGGNITVH